MANKNEITLIILIRFKTIFKRMIIKIFAFNKMSAVINQFFPIEEGNCINNPRSTKAKWRSIPDNMTLNFVVNQGYFLNGASRTTHPHMDTGTL